MTLTRKWRSIVASLMFVPIAVSKELKQKDQQTDTQTLRQTVRIALCMLDTHSPNEFLQKEFIRIHKIIFHPIKI